MTAKPDSSKPRPERDDTDESLRAERTNTDDVLSETQTLIEKAADEVIERAREKADAVLDLARDRADAKLDTETVAVRAQDAVSDERAREDEALRRERATADAALRTEREERVRALAVLLPLERETTDRHLLTERARSDDALAHRDDFLGMVTHDLRNLLHGIVSSAKALSLQASQTDEGKRSVVEAGRIERYVARMNRLIGDLLDVASIEAGKLAVHPQPGDAAKLVAEAVEVFAGTAKNKGLSLTGETGGPLPVVYDSERTLQVLANLIANAIRFTDRGGRVTVRAERAGGAVHVRVTDTGQGIAADMLEPVFERFWQAGKNEHKGLGLGLYISRCIVDAHGGKIWAESTPGSGSTFHFTIPATAPAAA